MSAQVRRRGMDGEPERGGGLTRRRFVRTAWGVAAGVCLPRWVQAEPSWPTQPRVAATIDFQSPAFELPADFVGLSFETGRVAEDDYLTPENGSLVRLLQTLGSGGVLRLGGNSSDFVDWPGSPIEERQIARFAEFLHAIGWKLIYGLNVGTGEREQARAEAEWVTRRCGEALVGFQLGNEPDLFGAAGKRRPEYDVGDYLRDWRRFADAVRARVPGAQFGGPDVSYRAEWLAPFARDAGPGLVFLSQHYYSEGPAGDPGVTISKMLASLPDLVSRLRFARKEVAGTGRRLRMTEVNSVYHGGQEGISDTGAAAIWVVGVALALATEGWTGFNLHSNQGAVYSPVLRGADGAFHPRPTYHALRFLRRFAAGSVCPVRLEPATPSLTAAGFARADGVNRLVVANLSLHATARLALPKAFQPRVRVHTFGAAVLNEENLEVDGVSVAEGERAWVQPGEIREFAPGATAELGVPPVSVVVLETA